MTNRHKWIGLVFSAAQIAAAQQAPPSPTFRAGIQLVQVSVVAQDKPVADLRREEFQMLQALNRPIDATAIPVKASVTRARDRLNLEAMLDVGSLDLQPERNLSTGKIEVVGRFNTADGIVASDAFAQTLKLNFNQSTYEKAMRFGLAYHKELKIPARAVELKMLFANPASGKIGTLTIPLSKVTQ